jgi:hypothetical protein
MILSRAPSTHPNGGSWVDVLSHASTFAAAETPKAPARSLDKSERRIKISRLHSRPDAAIFDLCDPVTIVPRFTPPTASWNGSPSMALIESEMCLFLNVHFSDLGIHDVAFAEMPTSSPRPSHVRSTSESMLSINAAEANKTDRNCDVFLTFAFNFAPPQDGFRSANTPMVALKFVYIQAATFGFSSISRTITSTSYRGMIYPDVRSLVQAFQTRARGLQRQLSSSTNAP